MCSKSFFKRIVPFFLTFAVGLFIASFFVTIAAPSFRFGNDFRRQHQERDRRMEIENQRLREENFRLKQNQSGKDDETILDFSSEDLNVPPPPMPPAPLRNVRR